MLLLLSLTCPTFWIEGAAVAAGRQCGFYYIYMMIHPHHQHYQHHPHQQQHHLHVCELYEEEMGRVSALNRATV